MTDLTNTTVDLGGSVTLNAVDADGTVWRLNQDGLTGWGTPASTITPVQKPRQAGAWAGDSFDTPRVVTAAGTIRAVTPALLNAAISRLEAAVTNADFTLTIAELGIPRWVTARKQGETLTPKVTNLIANYSIQVVAVDPRRFGTEMVGSTHLPMTSGGLTVPFTIPFTIDSTVVSGQVNLTNPSPATAPVGPVRLRIDGPCTGPVVTHVSSGLSLTFAASLVLGAGEWLDIDMEKRTALANGTASRNGYITSRGWSGFDPGDNTWAFSAAAYDAGSLLTVTATPAT